MSWESKETKKNCPCGKGTYTVIDRSDDWGRFETRWQMDCLECKVNYSLYEYYYHKSGLAEVGFKWVEKAKYKEAMSLKNKALELRIESDQLTKKIYLPVLLEMFSKSSKKSIWETLKSKNRGFVSLGTFYKHTKGKTKEEYLSELFNVNTLETVFSLVSIDNAGIDSLVQRAEEFERDASKLLYE